MLGSSQALPGSEVKCAEAVHVAADLGRWQGGKETEGRKKKHMGKVTDKIDLGAQKQVTVF